MNAQEISEAIEKHLPEIRSKFGETGKRDQCVIYEGDDGKFCTVNLITNYEHYELDRILFGQEIADHNYSWR